MRHDQRAADQLRPLEARRAFTGGAPGSVYVRAGKTTILCTASIEAGVPPWKAVPEGETPTGWLTAEYNMLPGSTSPRKRRDRTKVDGRTTEIQRLIGRSLRAVTDFTALGAHTITIDCDVLEADGGTRTLSITGGFIAAVDAVQNFGLPESVFPRSVAAISVGMIEGDPVLDLDYIEDRDADVDMNVVMTGDGSFIEVQGTAEGQTFARSELDELLDLAAGGVEQLTEFQKSTLGEAWPL